MKPDPLSPSERAAIRDRYWHTSQDGIVVHQLLNDLDAAYAEIQRLAHPCPGDIESQAAAWSAVWMELESAGNYSFVGELRDLRGRTRAVEFIRHLAKEITELRAVLNAGKASEMPIDLGNEDPRY